MDVAFDYVEGLLEERYDDARKGRNWGCTGIVFAILYYAGCGECTFSRTQICLVCAVVLLASELTAEMLYHVNCLVV